MTTKITVAVAALGLAAACSGSSSHGSSSSQSGSSSHGGNEIDIKSFGFGKPLTVQPGATITVRNEDNVPHTVTDKGLFDVQADPGKPVTFKAPANPGSYPLMCRFHPDMHGVLTVR